MAVTRSTTASWVIPTVNEWYKAAYYVGGGTNAGYWLYPTQNNNPPSNVLSTTGANNANFTATINSPPFSVETDPTNWLTPVGAFANSPSSYGTYDEGGDVEQWNESVDPGIGRGVYGGSFSGGYGGLMSGAAGYVEPSFSNEALGFRAALVPEPGSLPLVVLLTIGLVLLAIAFSPPWRASKTKICHARIKGQRLGFRLLRFEGLEAKRLLAAALYFDSSLGDSWNVGDDWRSGSPSGPQTGWSDGSDAFIQAGSGTIYIATSTQVSPHSITVLGGANCTVQGGTVALSGNMDFDVQPGTEALVNSCACRLGL